MIRRLRQVFTLQYEYRDIYQRTIASDLLRFVIILATILATLLVIPTLLGFFPLEGPVIFTVVTAYSVLFIMGALIQFGQVTAARNLLILLAVVATASSLLQLQRDLGTVISFLIPLVAAGLLASRATIIAVALMTVGVFAFLLFSQTTFSIVITPANRVGSFISILINLALFAQFFIVFGAGQQRLAQAFSRDIRTLQRSLESTELEKLDTDEKTLIATSLKQLKPGFERVQIYLVEAGTGATAVPYYEAFGLDEVQVGQPIDLSTTSAVSEVVRSGELLTIGLESGDVRLRHLGAGMQMAVLVPIMSDDRVLGVFDFQLNTLTVFSEAQNEVFLAYGRRLGAALARTRLVAQLYADVRLQQSVIAGLNQRVELLERGTRSDIDASSWESYFREYAQGALLYELGSSTSLTHANQLTPDMNAALSEGQFVTQPDEDQLVVNVPILLRGVLLGALTFRMPAGTEINVRQRELIQSVVDRLALSLENRRLLQQSQVQARRESKANEVANVLFSTTDLTSLLSLAAEQFNEALGAINTEVTVDAQEIRETS